MSTVLVTGGTGFIASHAILQLLAAGHTVRTTVRGPARLEALRTLLRAGGGEHGDEVRGHTAELTQAGDWPAAVAGCDYVLHVASPVPAGVPKHEDELIVPAREGALNVLRAARDAGVRRVVITSSFAAIGYGHPPRAEPLDESTWTQLGPGVSAYVKSKTLAERAAWDFIAREGGALELAVVNPVGVFGPVLGADYSSSITLIRSLMTGGVPACPRIWFGAVDVRDVADLHLRAMTHPAAAGERFLATAGDFQRLVEVSRLLKRRLGSHARRAPTLELPDFAVRVAARFSPMARSILPELGKVKNGTPAKAQSLLGWEPRSSEEAIVATGESLRDRGLLGRG